MRMQRTRWYVWLGSFTATLLVLSIAAAAILAEGAVHPLLTRRASDTAALAYSIGQATGATVRKVTIRADDGVMLNAWWLVPQQRTGHAVMVCHGVADSAYGALGYALLFLKNGYSVLVPESRGHGESGGFVTYGVLESEDTVRWLRWMKNNQINEAFGFGESLGGAILIESLARGADFHALAVESSYSSFEAVARERVARVIWSPAAFLLVKEGILYTYLRYGVNLSNARPDLAIAHARAPILLIHGLADNETSPEHSIQLAKSNPAITKLWLVPAAKHTGVYATTPAAFEQTVLQWFESPLKQPASTSKISFHSHVKARSPEQGQQPTHDQALESWMRPKIRRNL
jgi:pimeloyl-ACP methyl ester carboxylesterase